MIEDISPDNIVEPYGILSPSGEWFSCHYGEHEKLASEIVVSYFDRFNFNNTEKYRILPGSPKVVKSKREASVWTGFYDSLSFLTNEYGYISLGNLVGDYSGCWNIIKSPTRSLTKRQYDKIFKLIEIHGVKIDWNELN